MKPKQECQRCTHKRDNSISKNRQRSTSRSRGVNNTSRVSQRDCKACRTIEKNNQDLYNKKDNLLSIDDMNFMAKLNMMTSHSGACQVHSTEPLLYCRDCKVMACLDCHFMRKEHVDHKIIPIKNAMSYIAQESQIVYDALYYFDTDVIEQIQNSQLNHNMLAKKHQEQLAHLTHLFKKIYLEIQKKEIELTKQIDSYYASKLKQNQIIIQNLESIKTGIIENQNIAQQLAQQIEHESDINLGSKYHKIQIFHSFLQNMNKARKLDNRDIPQIQYDTSMKILTEIQKFAYFDFKTKPPFTNNEHVLNREYAQMTHTNLQTQNVPDLKQKHNHEYKEYLKQHKHNISVTKSNNYQRFKSNSKSPKNYQREAPNISPSHRQWDLQKTNQLTWSKIHNPS